MPTTGKYTTADIVAATPTPDAGQTTAAGPSADAPAQAQAAPDDRNQFQRIYDDAAAPVTDADRAGHNFFVNGLQTLGRGALLTAAPLVHPVKMARALPRMAEDAAGTFLDYQSPGTYEQLAGRTNLGNQIAEGMANDAEKEKGWYALDLLGQLAGAEGEGMVLGRAATALKPAARWGAVKVANSVIKPAAEAGDFGSPAEGMLNMPGGMRSWSLGQLKKRVASNLAKTTGEVSMRLAGAPYGTANVYGAVADPFYDAMETAAQANKTGLFGSLKNARQAYTHNMAFDPFTPSIVDNGEAALEEMSPQEIFNLKKRLRDDSLPAGEPYGGDLTAVRKQAYNNLKEQLDELRPDLKPLNDQYDNLSAGDRAMDARLSAATRKPKITPGDVLAGAGVHAAGHPAAIGFALKKAADTTAARTLAADGLWGFAKMPAKVAERAPYSLFLFNHGQQKKR